VIETPTFQRQADAIWSEEERFEFVTWISQHPMAGEVIPGAGGARKVRWSVGSQGKRGGVRVIYFNLSAEGVVYLIAVYKKSKRENMAAGDIMRVIP